MTDLATKPSHPPTRRPGRRSYGTALTHTVLLVGGVVMVMPLLYQLMMSLSSNAEVQSVPPSLWPERLQWHNYADVFSTINFGHQLYISILITVIRVIAQVLLASLSGYAFARMRFRGNGVLLAIVLSVMMIPPQIYLISQYQLIHQLGWLNTVMGIVTPGLATAFGTFLMRQFFLGLPDELEEAARLDGANPFQIFSRIMMPLARNGMFALGIMTTMWSWNELLWPLVITTDDTVRPLSVGIANLQGQYESEYPLMMAASLMAIAPILILFIVFQKRVIAGVARTGIK
ncbi:sugar ABC transporter permease [Brachybacterium vulturis]|uniref:Sugar ABC transporter permease n=1 Tax=Brachybacterium vulturis TaxID=2017484 RepID=A0A291GP08_9MICO|nr:carbohydrate ABC transporter permease [Brachybacterium vulturis]ATG51918.1 sugar ABC transporter permease [Brachybacterium vulturis]